MNKSQRLKFPSKEEMDFHHSEMCASDDFVVQYMEWYLNRQITAEEVEDPITIPELGELLHMLHTAFYQGAQWAYNTYAK